MLPSFRAREYLKQVYVKHFRKLKHVLSFSNLRKIFHPIMRRLEEEVTSLRILVSRHSSRFSLDTVAHELGGHHRGEILSTKMFSHVFSSLWIGHRVSWPADQERRCIFNFFFFFLFGLENLHYLWVSKSKNFPSKSLSELVAFCSGIP